MTQISNCIDFLVKIISNCACMAFILVCYRFNWNFEIFPLEPFRLLFWEILSSKTQRIKNIYSLAFYVRGLLYCCVHRRFPLNAVARVLVGTRQANLVAGARDFSEEGNEGSGGHPNQKRFWLVVDAAWNLLFSVWRYLNKGRSVTKFG